MYKLKIIHDPENDEGDMALTEMQEILGSPDGSVLHYDLVSYDELESIKLVQGLKVESVEIVGGNHGK